MLIEELRDDAPLSTASSVQVRQPLYFGLIGRWKRYGDRIESLRETLGELAENERVEAKQ